ncbi:uncharacterized protein LOC109704704 [Ananas comosus]|uniref:Uncharacterized protein LOC109704704 n=1 Tax=Ananas comosus TaxID=4615 RepID=A0A6P5EI15_ANACO|nr:uncharacterized protein LOC109704704 [Ananas comosus]
MLLRDLRREGLFPPHSRGVFLSGAPYRLHLLHRYELKPISSASELKVGDRSIDFMLAADGFCDASFAFAERVLRIGGITAVRLSSDPNYSLHLPPNYRMVYIRRFGSTFVAIKKTAHSATNGYISGTGRRLLAVPEAKKEALKGLEDVVLEPPPDRRELQKLYKSTRFLPDLIDTSLSEYPRRVFVDVGESEMGETEKWFEEHYPARNFKFEIIRLDFAGRGKKTRAAGLQGISEWMGGNVNEEDYVVMKVEAEVAEEMLRGKAIKLVDELFLECKHQWQKERMSSTGRAYWECLALYGKLRDEGVAVHQWWG